MSEDRQVIDDVVSTPVSTTNSVPEQPAFHVVPQLVRNARGYQLVQKEGMLIVLKNRGRPNHVSFNAMLYSQQLRGFGGQAVAYCNGVIVGAGENKEILEQLARKYYGSGPAIEAFDVAKHMFVRATPNYMFE